MDLELREEEMQRIEAMSDANTRNLWLFDFRTTMVEADVYMRKYRPDPDDGCNGTIPKGQRLLLAILFWKMYPWMLRSSLDRYWLKYPELEHEYSFSEIDFSNVYNRVCVYLMHVADLEGFNSTAISVAGRICHEIVKNRRDRQRLWGDDYSPGYWPECHPDLLNVRPDHCQSILSGAAEIDRLSLRMMQWLSQQSDADSMQDSLPLLIKLPKDTVTSPIASSIEPPVEPEIVFRKVGDGDVYFIKGFGEQGHVSASRAKGLHDLYRLVQTPGVAVPMLEIDAGPGVKQGAGDGRSRQPVADGETMKQLAAKRKQLKSDIEAAESDMERNELKAELVKLEESAKGMTGLKGKSRDLNNPLNNLRPKILGRKATAIAQIRKWNMPTLADHFELTVTTEAGCVIYSPGDPNLSWDTSDKK